MYHIFNNSPKTLQENGYTSFYPSYSKYCQVVNMNCVAIQSNYWSLISSVNVSGNSFEEIKKQQGFVFLLQTITISLSKLRHHKACLVLLPKVRLRENIIEIDLQEYYLLTFHCKFLGRVRNQFNAQRDIALVPVLPSWKILSKTKMNLSPLIPLKFILLSVNTNNKFIYFAKMQKYIRKKYSYYFASLAKFVKLPVSLSHLNHLKQDLDTTAIQLYHRNN